MNIDGPCGEATTSDVRTRDRVLGTVSQSGPITAAEVADRLGLTPAAVRRHLDALTDSGRIQESEVAGSARRRGRPARAYVLAEAGHEELPEEYASLAVSLLEQLQHDVGQEAVTSFAGRRADQLLARLAPALERADTLQERTQALAAALDAEGYAASVRPVGHDGTVGLQLCQGHCPVQQVAAQYPQFCDAEREAFGRLLGVHVQRLASLAHGDHVCTTFIPEAALTSGPPGTDPPTFAPTTDKDPR